MPVLVPEFLGDLGFVFSHQVAEGLELGLIDLVGIDYEDHGCWAWDACAGREVDPIDDIPGIVVVLGLFWIWLQLAKVTDAAEHHFIA